MDTVVIHQKKRDGYFEHGQMHSCNPKTQVYFGVDQETEARGRIVLIFPGLWQDERGK